MAVFLGGCFGDKGCLPEVEESRENQDKPRLKKRGLRFLYGMAPAHEKMFGQIGKYFTEMILKERTRDACQRLQ